MGLHPVLAHISDIDGRCSMTGCNSFVIRYLNFDIVEYYKNPASVFFGFFYYGLSYFCYYYGFQISLNIMAGSDRGKAFSC